MKKYGESKAFYTTNQNLANNITNNPKEVKITIIVPMSDGKDINHVNVVAMVKIDQLKTIDVQEELKSENNKDKFFNRFFLYKKLIMIIKIFNSIKSKILPYRFILFSIVFL